MVITSHAKKRMKQRCGYNRKIAKKMAKKALEHGIPHKELDGNLCRWVNRLYLSQRKANNIRIYGKEAYLFHHKTLLTVIPIPKEIIDKEVE